MEGSPCFIKEPYPTDRAVSSSSCRHVSRHSPRESRWWRRCAPDRLALSLDVKSDELHAARAALHRRLAANGREGSFSTEIRCPRYVRFPPDRDQIVDFRHFGFGPIAFILHRKKQRAFSPISKVLVLLLLLGSDRQSRQLIEQRLGLFRSSVSKPSANQP